MSEPRGVEERLQWMAAHEPGDPGWCAKWTWYACGGNQNPPNPPAWGAPNANAVVDKCKAAGVLHTDRDAPRGAIVLWTSSTHGHMALSKGPQDNLDIMSTDPYGDWGATGTMPQKWPEQNWGQKWAGWTTHYAGVDLPMDGDDVSYNYWYSGKPGGVLHIGRDYKNMDIDEWDAPGSGLEGVLTYANCSGFVFTGGQPGRIRVRLDRGNEDYTGYMDYVVVPGTSELLITHNYFEKGDGTRTWVGFKALDGLQSFDIGTRYMKRWLIK